MGSTAGVLSSELTNTGRSVEARLRGSLARIEPSQRSDVQRRTSIPLLQTLETRFSFAASDGLALSSFVGSNKELMAALQNPRASEAKICGYIQKKSGIAIAPRNKESSATSTAASTSSQPISQPQAPLTAVASTKGSFNDATFMRRLHIKGESFDSLVKAAEQVHLA